MRQIAEKLVAERIVSKILNNAATVSESVRLIQIRRTRLRKPLLDRGPQQTLPGEVDQLLVREHRISVRCARDHTQQPNQQHRTATMRKRITPRCSHAKTFLDPDPQTPAGAAP